MVSVGEAYRFKVQDSNRSSKKGIVFFNNPKIVDNQPEASSKTYHSSDEHLQLLQNHSGWLYLTKKIGMCRLAK